MLRRTSVRRSAPVLAALSALALFLTSCSNSTSGTPSGTVSNSSSASGSSSSAASSSASTSASPKPKPKIPVHIKTLNEDGAQYGVGMPIIAYFSHTPKSAKPFADATKVTVNGKAANGAWYFEQSSLTGYPVEAHYRPQNYWPANSQVHVDLPMKGVSAGGNMAYDDSLTLDFSIGASHVLTVLNRTHTLTAVFDGKTEGTYPVSLGAPNTPTLRGTKVIMEKGRDISMKGPGYYDPHVKWTQRLTYGGEYLHAAPWNCVGAPGCVGPQNNIGRADSSNGCTNLRPDDAKKLYGLLQIGDVVQFPDATGPRMQLGQGYGDWNIFWSQWQTGGLVSTQH